MMTFIVQLVYLMKRVILMIFKSLVILLLFCIFDELYEMNMIMKGKK